MECEDQVACGPCLGVVVLWLLLLLFLLMLFLLMLFLLILVLMLAMLSIHLLANTPQHPTKQPHLPHPIHQHLPITIPLLLFPIFLLLPLHLPLFTKKVPPLQPHPSLLHQPFILFLELLIKLEASRRWLIECWVEMQMGEEVVEGVLDAQEGRECLGEKGKDG